MLADHFIDAPINQFVNNANKKILLLTAENEFDLLMPIRKVIQASQQRLEVIDINASDLMHTLNEACIKYSNILILYGFTSDNPLENFYEKFHLQRSPGKVIFIYKASLLHPTLDPGLYFAPVKNNRLQKELLSCTRVISPFPKRTAIVPQAAVSSASLSVFSQLSNNDIHEHYLNKKLMTNDPVMMSMLANRIVEDEQFKQKLFDVITATRTNKKIQIFAANAITALCYANASFSGMDLSKIDIPQADLAGALLHQTDLSYSNLAGANLRGAFLLNTILNHANLSDVQLGEEPILKHASRITTLCCSPDGRMIATGTDCYVYLWDAHTFQLIAEIYNENRFINSLVFSPDSKYLVIANRKLQVWDIHASRIIHRLESHTGEIECVAYSRNGNIIASASDDNTVILWNAKSGEKISTYHGHNRKVKHVAFGPDDSIIISAGWDNTLQAWHVPTATELFKIEHRAPVSAIAYSPTGKYISSAWSIDGHDEYNLELWNAHDGSSVYTFKGHTHEINSIAFSNDGARLVSGSVDEIVRVWDVIGKSLIYCFTGHTDRITSVAFTADDQYVLSASFDESVRVWSVTARTNPNSHLDKAITSGGNTQAINKAAYSPNGLYWASAGADEHVRLWQTKNNILLRTLSGHMANVAALAFSGDSCKLASSGHDNLIHIWSVPSGELITRFEGKTGVTFYLVRVNGSPDNALNGLKFTPDGNTLIVAAGGGNEARRLNAQNGELITSYNHEGEHHHCSKCVTVNCIETSSNGKYLVAGIGDGSIIVWNLNKNKQQYENDYNDLLPAAYVSLSSRRYRKDKNYKSPEFTLKAADHYQVFDITFNRHDNQLLSALGDGKIKLWDFDRKELIKTFYGHKSPVSSVMFNNEGTEFISGGFDGTIRVWSISSGKCIQTIHGHLSKVNSVKYDQDNKNIISAGNDRAVRIWQEIPATDRKRNWILIWSSEQTDITAINCTLYDVDGLNTRQIAMLQQHGAVVESTKVKFEKAYSTKTYDQYFRKLKTICRFVDITLLSELFRKAWPTFLQKNLSKVFFQISCWNIVNAYIAHIMHDNDAEVRLRYFARSMASELFINGQEASVVKLSMNAADHMCCEALVEQTSAGLSRFRHKIFYDYFVADYLSVSFESNVINTLENIFGIRSLSKEYMVLQFLVEWFHGLKNNEQEAFLKAIIGWLQYQRNKNQIGYTNANILTLLNAAGIAFSGMNLSHLDLSGTNLDGALLDDTNFESTKLTGVSLVQSYCRNTNFNKALLDDIYFGEFPGLLQKDHILALVKSENDRLIATVIQNYLYIWDINTRTILHKIKMDNDGFIKIDFNISANYLAYSGVNCIHVLAVENNSHYCTFIGHTEAVTDVKFCADSEHVVTSSIDKTIRLWSLKTKALIHIFDTPDVQGCVAVSKINREILSGGDGKQIYIWDIETKKRIASLEGHEASILRIEISATDRYVASAGTDNVVIVWDYKTKTRLMTLDDRQCLNTLIRLAFSPNEEFFAANNFESNLQLYDLSKQRHLHTFYGHLHKLTGIAFAADSQSVYSSSLDGTIRLWSVNQGKILSAYKRQGHEFSVTHISFSSDAKLIASSSGDRTVQIWNIKTHERLQTITGYAGVVLCHVFSPDNKMILTADDYKIVRLWKVEDGELLQTYRTHAEKIISVAYSPNGKFFASAGADAKINIYRENIPCPVKVLTEEDNQIMCIAISPNSKFLASSGTDKFVRLWNVKTGELVSKSKEQQNVVLCVTFNHDGQLLYSSDVNTVCVWNTLTNKLLHQLEGHTKPVRSIACSPDGKLLATSSFDGTVKLWNTQSYQNEHTLEVCHNAYANILFSPDSRFLAIVNADHAVCLWERHQEASNPAKWLLVWETHRTEINLSNCSIDDVVNVNEANHLYMKQRGAKGEPVKLGANINTLFGNSSRVELNPASFIVDHQTQDAVRTHTLQ